MNCGSSAGTIENPARPRISAAHMAATTGAEGAAVADRARVTVPNEENPGWGNRGSGGRRTGQFAPTIDGFAVGDKIDLLKTAVTRPTPQRGRVPAALNSRTPTNADRSATLRPLSAVSPSPLLVPTKSSPT